jgi:alpha-glucosidase
MKKAYFLTAALLSLSTAQPVFAKASSDSSITVASTGSNRLWVRVEAVNANVARVWYSTSGQFARKTSLALENMRRSPVQIHVDRAENYLSVRSGNLLLQVDRKSLAVQVFDAKKKSLILDGLNLAETHPDGSWRLTERLASDEHLLGLGEDNRNQGKLERRGTVRDLWAGQQINSGNVTAQYPVPFMLSTGHSGHAYGVFLDNVHHLRYDLAKTTADRIQISAAGGEADVYVIDGPTPKNVISRYTAMTGRPSLPPLWTMGYIQSRCVFYNWGDVDAAYQGLRERGYPFDSLVIDYQWHDNLCDFRWAPRWTVDGVPPDQRISDYGKKGVKIVLYGSPMVIKSAPTYAAGWADGVFATDGKGHPVQGGYYNGDLLDFTAPRMNEWLWPQLKPHDDAGVYGWWLDLTEPEGEPPQTVYHGGTAAEIHNSYSLRVTKSFEGALLKDHPNARPWILTRAGSAGIQAHHAALWTGDISSDYATLAAHPGEMLNSGISGLNSWACDTGGFLTGYYKNDRYGAHARLYERWMQFSVFAPITRAHKAGLCMPYEFGPATEQGTKKYINLRYRLLPYIYSHYYEANQTGIPIVRAMSIEFPNDPNCLDLLGDQYMFGASLLVAPVLNEGVSKRAVYFPTGKWIDWDYGYEYQGGRTWVVNAPQNHIPVAVRAGAIIPLAPNMANTQTGKWDPLTLEVFPHESSAFTMVQDDGTSFDYLKGKSTKTSFASKESPTHLSFTIGLSNRLFVPKAYLLRFHLDRKPMSAAVDGVPVKMRWDGAARILEMPIVANARLKRAVAVRLSSELLAARPAPLLIVDNVDAKGTTTEKGGPTPHFFPGPALPARVPAIDYDNGGEGVAFHVSATKELAAYRSDNAGIVRAPVPSGYALAGLQKDDWVRYSVNTGNGGYFDLIARVKGNGGQFRLLSAARNLASPITVSSGSEFQNVVVPNVYLNPGEDSLMLYVDRPGFELDSLEFRQSVGAPNKYPAEFAASTGQVVSVAGSLGNVGQLRGSVTMGIAANTPGSHKLRVRYANGGRNVRLNLSINNGETTAIEFPNTGGEDGWKDLDLSVDLRSGPNRLTLSWNTSGYDSISIQNFSVLDP